MDISIQILISMGLFSSYPRISQFFVHPPTSKTPSQPCRPRTGAAVDVGHQAAGGQPAIITGWWFGSFFPYIGGSSQLTNIFQRG